MKFIALLLSLLLATHSDADLFVTTFTAVNGSAQATGVWRNETTGTDLTIPVSLSQTGGAATCLTVLDAFRAATLAGFTLRNAAPTR